jgi:hypothetical protein
MPIKGFGTAPSVSGIEELISATFTVEMDQVQVEPGTGNTAVTVVSYYNPRMTAALEGISSGATVSSTFVAYGNTFRTTGANISKSVGDVQKVNVTGIYYPSVAS